jgi:glycosyltransferase involved in cell wall biosynthesis
VLVDVSELVRRDAKSGIQRVVRSILDMLLRQPPTGFRIEPVYADPGQPYRYARTFASHFLGLADNLPPDEPIDTDAGDIFLGLDLALDEIPANRTELESMRNRGVKTFFVVYDQLPLRRADCFPPHAYGLFNNWMEAIADLSDGLLCISRSVEVHVRQHLDAMQRQRFRPLKLGHFHLGADVPSSKPTNGITPEQQALVDQLRRAPSFLMVGTIEPRKGHEQAISAFEMLWAQGESINLVLVGKAGWMTSDLVQRIRSHAETGNRLFWFEDASDELLLRLYASCSALLAPSEGEGFGLPLVEAAQHGLPILCRNLPVFLEVAGQHATYFSGYDGADLAAAVAKWLALRKDGAFGQAAGMPWKGWGQSTQQMLGVLLHDQWDGTWMPGENYWFAASDPATRIGVGRRERDRVACDGSSGILLRTRGIAVPGGRYRLQVRGEWLARVGKVHAEIHVGPQRNILAGFEFAKVPTANGLLLNAELELASRSTELEVWIVSSGDARLEIEGCGLKAAPLSQNVPADYNLTDPIPLIAHPEAAANGRAAT